MAAEERNELINEIDRLKKRLLKKNRELRELKMTNLFMETLFNGISEEIMVIDQDYCINDVNSAFLNQLGLNKKDVLGIKCHEIKGRFWTPCHYGKGLCPAKQAEKTGEMVELSHSYTDDKGDPKESMIITYPLKPEGDEIKYFLEITRDVTEYRALTSKLKRSEKRFKAILDTATDAIISINEDSKIILFNKAAQKIFGYSSHEALGMDLDHLISPEYGDHRKYVERFLEKRAPNIIGRAISLNALRKNGERFPIELGLSVLDMGGRITFTAIIRDLTESRKMEGRMLQSERLAAVGQAVAHVAHEIRNPLMIIGGFTNQIRTCIDDEKDLHKIDMVLDEVMRLERLVANVGDFTKEYKLVKRSSDINSVITDVINIMTGACTREKYTFNKELSEQVGEINCDPDKLKQVFINIISNGLEAMQDGGAITVSTKKIPEGVEIRINDEGIGIPNEGLRHIFEPFYTTRESGSGLGLAISYKLIEAHNGDIWAVSRPGEGATFIIQLPDG